MMASFSPADKVQDSPPLHQCFSQYLEKGLCFFRLFRAGSIVVSMAAFQKYNRSLCIDLVSCHFTLLSY